MSLWLCRWLHSSLIWVWGELWGWSHADPTVSPRWPSSQPSHVLWTVALQDYQLSLVSIFSVQDSFCMSPRDVLCGHHQWLIASKCGIWHSDGRHDPQGGAPVGCWKQKPSVLHFNDMRPPKTRPYHLYLPLVVSCTKVISPASQCCFRSQFSQI